MFYIIDVPWQSEAEIYNFWMDTFYYFDYSMIYCIIGSVEIYVKWMDYLGWKEEAEMGNIEYSFKKFICEDLGDEISRVLLKLEEMHLFILI